MLSSTSRALEGSGDVAAIKKPLIVRRFLSANRDCIRWPDAAHFAAPCTARQISELRLTDFVVRNVPADVDAVQLQVINFANAHLVSLNAPLRKIRWPNLHLASVSAQSWRTLTGVPANTLPESVVEVPNQGLFTIVSVQGTSAELNRPLNIQIPFSEVTIAAPLVPANDRTVRTADSNTVDFEHVYPGDILVVRKQRLRVTSKVSDAELEVDTAPAWTGGAAYSVINASQSDVSGALAVLPVASGQCVLDRTAAFQFSVKPELATRISELEFRVTDAYGELLQDLNHRDVEIELAINESK